MARMQSSDSRPPSANDGGVRSRDLEAVVHGCIAGALPGQTVRAHAVRLSDERSVGETFTDTDGNYDIHCDANAFAPSDTGRAALRVAVYRLDGTEQLSSRLYFNVEPDTTVNLEILPDAEAPRASEYARLHAELHPVLQGIAVAGLREKDIDFLAGATAIDRRKIEWLAEAAAHEQTSMHGDLPASTYVPATAIPAAAFYAWFRSNLPTDAAALWSTSTDTLIDTLDAAVARNVVPAIASDERIAIRGRIDEKKHDLVLAAPRAGSTATLGQLLATMPLPLDLQQQRAVAATLPELHHDDPKLVERIGAIAGFAGDSVAVARTLRLDALTAGHLAMTQALQSRVASDTEGALRPLASLRPDQWLDLAYTHGSPDNDPRSPIAYADALAATIERQHPTAALSAHLSQERRLAQQPALTDVGAFLGDNPDFDIVTANINAVQEDGDLRNVKDHQQLVDGLLTLQRMRGLDATWDETAALMEAGFDSPHQLLMTGPTQLTTRLGGRITGDRLTDLFESANTHFATTFGGYTAAFSGFSGPHILGTSFLNRPNGGDPAPGDPGVGGGVAIDPRLGDFIRQWQLKNPLHDVTVAPRGLPARGAIEVPVNPHDRDPKFVPAAIARHPTLQSLFGSQDACACGHCSSVLSPAAYFVDVLQFLEDGGVVQGLFGRRPDLQDLELSCANTNTEVPSIDLALEVLENAVALPLDVALPFGTDIEGQLRGAKVADDVRDSLATTVRAIAGDLRATFANSGIEPGTSDWTVADGRRRWTLTVQKKVLRAETDSGALRLLNTDGLDRTALDAALDSGTILTAAQDAFADLFAPKQRQAPDVGDYDVTVTPTTKGQAWRVSYAVVANALLDSQTKEATLQTSAGTVWWKEAYSDSTIATMQEELAAGETPELLRRLLIERYGHIGNLARPKANGHRWVIASLPRVLDLSDTPAKLTITSLAYQSGDAAADAIAWPENHNPAAYEKLETATFPWSLPLDLPLEETRLFLARARSSRRGLMELRMAALPGAQDVAALAHEVLGLSEAEAKVVAQTSADAVYARWGVTPTQTTIWDAAAGEEFTAASPLELLENVSVLLQQSQSSLDELLSILATQFVAPVADGPLVVGPQGECSPSKMRVSGLTVAHLDRIHRFARLEKRLGWDSPVLDTAIRRATGDVLNDATLEWLANVIRLHELLDAQLDSIVAWWPVPATAPDATRGRSLARALGMSIGELEDAALLFEVADVFVSPAVTLAFCERVKRVRQRGIAFEDLRYLLRHQAAPGSSLDLDDDQIARLFAAGVAAIRSAPTAEARQQAVIAALATGLNASRDVADELLRTRLRHPSDPPKPALDVFVTISSDPTTAEAETVAIEAVLVRLYKAVTLCGALSLGMSELQWLRKPPPLTDPNGFTALDFNTLPATSADAAASIVGVEQLIALADLRDVVHAAGLLRDYTGIAFGTAAQEPDVERVLRVGLMLSETADAASIAQADAQVRKAAIQLQISGDQYRDPIELARLVEFLGALKQLGATVDQAADLASPSPSDAVAVGARELLRSKYNDLSWHDLIKPIADTLRERQRDALVAFIIASDNLREHHSASPGVYVAPTLSDANAIYEHYLIDVQTGTRLRTTRLLQATAAAQLFTERSLLNLDGATLSDDKRLRWEWMDRYRVWEANRKIFLFPENWLLPELRDDKTDIFRQMEGALAEHEPSPEFTRAAVRGYLEDLSELSQISVIAMYEDRRAASNGAGGGPTEDTLYVIGRTSNEPFRYFWRSALRFADPAMSWSGWEALDLDNANDFIMPFVLDGDLHLAWPVFRKTAAEEDPHKPQWDIQLAWSRRTKQGWTKRKLGKLPLKEIRRLENKESDDSFAFRFSKSASTVSILGGDPISREKITIACYAANEALAMEEINEPIAPDPSPKAVGQTIGGKNVMISASGLAYEHARINSQTTKYRGVANVRVWMLGDYWKDEVTKAPFFVEKFTDSHGKFNFESRVAANRGNVTLQFFWMDTGVPEQFHATLEDANQQGNSEWQWQVNIARENLDITNFFLTNRGIRLEPAGAFTLEPGRDVTPESTFGILPIDALPPLTAKGNRFEQTAPPSGTLQFGTLVSWNAPRPPQPPFVVTKGARSAISADQSDPWYMEDVNGGFYLVERTTNGVGWWATWPDGQPFATMYPESLAADQLFLPASQAPLVNALANNFLRRTPYANYNWELFLHAPLAIADYLASHQRYAEARHWLHDVFDPTARAAPDGHTAFWRFLPFRNDKQPATIANLLTWLANPAAVDAATAAQAAANDPLDFTAAFGSQIAEWKDNPFMPHLVARLRPSAYEWYTFFAYLDVLIGWGDQQFRRDTRESVNEATLLYVLAADLLGPRPRTTPAQTPPVALTYRLLPKDKAGNLSGFSDPWVAYADLPGMKALLTSRPVTFSSHISATASSTYKKPTKGGGGVATLASLSALAFCVPQNEKLTEYYDRVEQRLFNVRHSRNIDGVLRDLPLFDPPIDPLLLIRAKAAGLDLDDIVAGSYAPPLPSYRFNVMLQKALELTGELKALGTALLSALEKRDGEELTLLRSRHEIAMLKLARDTRQQQVDEAEANILALQQSQETAKERFAQYQKLLGKSVVTVGQDGLPMVEQSSSLAVSTDAGGDGNGLGLIRKEVDQLRLTADANAFTQAANSAHILGGILSIIPNVSMGTAPSTYTFGGSNLGSAASAIAKAIEMGAVSASYFAGKMGTLGSYERRQDDWIHQSKLAVAELKQLAKQLLAAQIRQAIATLELRNHDTQIENAKAVDEFMHDKFTNQQLYRWMSSQISEVYFRTYQLAHDLAGRAERAYRHELGLNDDTTSFISSGYWDNLKKGLMAGEHLHHDLKRMDAAYLEQNRREYEITKHVSVSQLDPIQLIILKETGSCEISLPEALFDLDYPGHYLRRLKTVGISIPCVAGPYSSVNCTLTLEKSAVRRNPIAGTTYTEDPYSDPSVNFRSFTGSTQSIVTSNAQNDTGLFETNLRDERYLPFEGAGAISQWKLELPEQFPAFDYATISDVVLHLRYTARDASRDAGDDELKTKAIAELHTTLAALTTTNASGGLARVFSLRHEFPTEWHRFLNAAVGSTQSTAVLQLTNDRFPYLFQGTTLRFTGFDVIVGVEEQYAATHAGWVNFGLAPVSLSTTMTPIVPTPWTQALGKLLKQTAPSTVTGHPGAWMLTGWLQEPATDPTEPPNDKSPLTAATIDDVLLVCRYTV